MEEIAGTYHNGLLRIDLFVRDGQLIRKETYPTTVEEGPGREIETTVRKIGRDRFVFIRRDKIRARATRVQPSSRWSVTPRANPSTSMGLWKRLPE